MEYTLCHTKSVCDELPCSHFLATRIDEKVYDSLIFDVSMNTVSPLPFPASAQAEPVLLPQHESYLIGNDSLFHLLRP